MIGTDFYSNKTTDIHNSDPGINYKGLHCTQIVGGKKALH